MWKTAIVLIFLSGCALHPRIPYTPVEKVMLVSAIGGQVADYTTTVRGIDAGCEEANPLMKNRNVMIGTKIVMSGLIYGVSNAADSHSTRKWWLGLMSVIGWGAAINNNSLNCGR